MTIRIEAFKQYTKIMYFQVLLAVFVTNFGIFFSPSFQLSTSGNKRGISWFCRNCCWLHVAFVLCCGVGIV